MPIQTPTDILSQITQYAQQAGQTPTPAALPSLNYTIPTNLPDQYIQFLKAAADSPDIVNYYKQLLDYTQGDLQLAQQQLTQDYQTGVRQTISNLGGTLQQLGQTFTGESKQLMDDLNKRGIALTQDAGGKLQYAGGGEAQTELQQLNTSQQLRQEAEQRTAQQGIENAGLKLQSGLTSAGQSARNEVLGLKQQQQQTIENRASIPYSQYLNQQNINAQQALAKQQSSFLGGGGGQPDLPDPTRTPVNTFISGWRNTGKNWEPPAGYNG